MLAAREKLNADIRRILDEQTDAWGIKVSTVEIKHVDLNETMVRAIAQQAEAERARRAVEAHLDYVETTLTAQLRADRHAEVAQQRLGQELARK